MDFAEWCLLLPWSTAAGQQLPKLLAGRFCEGGHAEYIEASICAIHKLAGSCRSYALTQLPQAQQHADCAPTGVLLLALQASTTDALPML